MGSARDSRDSAVGLAGQTVSCSVEVLPHSVLFLLYPTGTAIDTHISILKVQTLRTVFWTLHKKHNLNLNIKC